MPCPEVGVMVPSASQSQTLIRPSEPAAVPVKFCVMLEPVVWPPMPFAPCGVVVSQPFQTVTLTDAGRAPVLVPVVTVTDIAAPVPTAVQVAHSPSTVAPPLVRCFHNPPALPPSQVRPP